MFQSPPEVIMYSSSDEIKINVNDLNRGGQERRLPEELGGKCWCPVERTSDSEIKALNSN
jgi:hypothetical protein